jgi:hypothetical protein
MCRFWILPLLSLSACSPSVTCDLVGSLVGTFVGDASGDLVIDIVQSKDDPTAADLTVTLTTPDLEAYGSAVITCDGGDFDLNLQTNDNTDFGDFGGTMGTGDGSGDWTFTTGETGTWSAGS